MAKGKWGESFLKSGLPLEHLTQVTLQTLRWSCTPHHEYLRMNREKQESWFEFDLTANAPGYNRDTQLSLLIECKYHDLSRFWFFLPHQIGRFPFNDSVLNCGPLQTLKKQQLQSFLSLAPTSSEGIVVSDDGQKQDNAVHTAIQQLVNGYVPYCLSTMFDYNIDFHNVGSLNDELSYVPDVTALIPMIVTNARIYRLRPDITDLDLIRKANSPSEIATEVEWTWCYHETPMPLFLQNVDAVDAHRDRYAELIYRFPFVDQRMREFCDRPHWIAVVNIRALSKVANTLADVFYELETRRVEDIMTPTLRKSIKGTHKGPKGKTKK